MDRGPKKFLALPLVAGGFDFHSSSKIHHHHHRHEEEEDSWVFPWFPGEGEGSLKVEHSCFYFSNRGLSTRDFDDLSVMASSFFY